jgi:hypothetical protein
MKNYKNRSNTSCVYDAFEAAGLPVEDYMLQGVLAEDVISLLERNGYRVYRTGSYVTSEQLSNGFFILWDTANSGKTVGHIEWHTNTHTILSMSSKDIGAIAIKI